MDGKKKIDAYTEHYNIIVAIALSLIGLGTAFYHHVEKFSWLDSVYFTVITLATVGYGDFTPKTAAGKIFTMLYVVVGIAIFVALAHSILAKVASRRMERMQARKDRKNARMEDGQ